MDIASLLTVESLVSLVTLTFLEIVLGVDNIVFITITSNRLPEEKQHIGRKLGLAGAFVSRCIFLCCASYLVHMVDPVFSVGSHGFSIRDLVLLVGGVYLIYKGIDELRGVLKLDEEREARAKAADGKAAESVVKHIGLPQAVGTIMVMDVAFSIDSVITAVGLAEHLIIMILAVFIAIILMMVFIDQVSDFINSHAEIKVLALVFITMIGVLLSLDGLGIHTGIEVLGMATEKVMVHFAMLFAFVLELIQMRYRANLKRFQKEGEGERG